MSQQQKNVIRAILDFLANPNSGGELSAGYKNKCLNNCRKAGNSRLLRPNERLRLRLEPLEDRAAPSGTMQGMILGSMFFDGLGGTPGGQVVEMPEPVATQTVAADGLEYELSPFAASLPELRGFEDGYGAWADSADSAGNLAVSGALEVADSGLPELLGDVLDTEGVLGALAAEMESLDAQLAPAFDFSSAAASSSSSSTFESGNVVGERAGGGKHKRRHCLRVGHSPGQIDGRPRRRWWGQ